LLIGQAKISVEEKESLIEHLKSKIGECNEYKQSSIRLFAIKADKEKL